eukprot:gnl/TRDRNA2_/TRDRNA2_155036_c0_seq1.p1 gnl/TRDRNA2_/TRDRNA2_155036_c0~~gnl/TRDRNA2_/TRDRNA2_155036_c0_seq1.p1  ORF type:complete len:176 (-),score=21.65 gnl/TRDRNA2_/TRDRNA2_155036_c0_seq1:214-741(-)
MGLSENGKNKMCLLAVCLIATFLAAGCVGIGIFLLPDDSEEGKCSATRPNKVKCYMPPGSKGTGIPQIEKASFTGSDGVAKSCELGFQLDVMPGGCTGDTDADEDAESVLQGEVRECKRQADGLCFEPGIGSVQLLGSIVLFILGACLLCAGVVGGVCVSMPKVEKPADVDAIGV